MPNKATAKPAFIETKMQSTPEVGVKVTLYQLFEPAGIVPAIGLVNLDSQSFALTGITDRKEDWAGSNSLARPNPPRVRMRPAGR